MQLLTLKTFKNISYPLVQSGWDGTDQQFTKITIFALYPIITYAQDEMEYISKLGYFSDQQFPIITI